MLEIISILLLKFVHLAQQWQILLTRQQLLGLVFAQLIIIGIMEHVLLAQQQDAQLSLHMEMKVNMEIKNHHKVNNHQLKEEI